VCIAYALITPDQAFLYVDTNKVTRPQVKEFAICLFSNIWRRELFSRVRQSDGVREKRGAICSSLFEKRIAICPIRIAVHQPVGPRVLKIYSQIWSTSFWPPECDSSTCQVEKEEISKHLQDSKVNVKGYSALFDDAVKMAKSGTVFWLDPGKPASRPLSLR
jgi:hypothetical protein